MSRLSDKYLLENVCQSCFTHFRMDGYSECAGCLWGFPEELDDEDVIRIKKLKEVQNDKQ